MEVCKKCHEGDREAINCLKEADQHHPAKPKINNCMICGEKRYLYLCPNYGGYNVRAVKKKDRKKK